MTEPSVKTPLVASLQSLFGGLILGPFFGLFPDQGLTSQGRAWRWPLVLSALIAALYITLSQSGWNPWASVPETLSLLADDAALSSYTLKAFAKPPWQWPTAYSISVFGITQSLLVLANNLRAMGLDFVVPVLQQSIVNLPKVLALLGIGLWLVTLRALLHRWGWPPIARWGAFTVFATHPTVWASAVTGAAWQGTLWTLLLLKAPSIIETASSALRPSRLPLALPPSTMFTPSVFLGCLLGASLWLLGPYGCMGAVATVTAIVIVCQRAQPRSSLAFASILRPFFLTLALLGLISELAALITQTPFSSAGYSLLPLIFSAWKWSTAASYGGWWLMAALIVALFCPTTVHLRLPSTPALRGKNNPALCWPKPLWLGGVLLGVFLSSPTLSTVWLCIGISQPLTSLKAESPLKGMALRCLDAMGAVLILTGLAAAVLLFQWCPDRLPWFTDTHNQTLVSLSLGSMAWEIAWWKLVVSGWLFSILILGFGLLLRGHRLTVQQGLGLTAASMLWVGVVLHAGVLPWIQPTPKVPSGLISQPKYTFSATSLPFHSALAPSTQQIAIQTMWHSVSQRWANIATQPVLKNLSSKENTLKAMSESHYYQSRTSNQQATAFQQMPVLRSWPHPTRGWLDTESIVWVLTSPPVAPTASIPHT